MRMMLPVLLTMAACTEPPPPEKAPRFDVKAMDARDQVETIAFDHLATLDRANALDTLVTRHSVLDAHGVAHLRLDQHYDGVPVLGGQVVVHVPVDGKPMSVTDRRRADLSVDVVPDLTEDEAIARARDHATAVDAVVDAVELFIVRRDDGDHLTWRVALRIDVGPSLPIAFVDANTGAIVLAYDDVKTARDRRTYDAAGTEQIPANPTRNETDPATGIPAVDDGHDFAGVTWDYYDQFHGRDSFDDAGAPVISVVDIGPNYVNAFWNGTYMGYGEGNNTFGSFSSALDVVAHEFTHAVTDATADLVYSEESGGLNEATSDIMAAVVESWSDGWVVSNDTWRVGEDLGSAFRNMSNPTSIGSSIDSYLDYTNSLNVHSTSGIANRAFVDWVDDPSLDIEEAGAIWYQALSAYMTTRTTFPEARQATQQAALDLYGPGPEVLAVSAGWDLVDVPGNPAYALFDDVGPITLSTNQTQLFSFSPDPAAVAVRFQLIGDNGDADLYVSAGSTPTQQTYDCRSISPRSRETCTFDPSTGTSYEVLVHAWSSFSDVQVLAWEAVPGGGPCPDADGDGVSTCAGDCDDQIASVRPGAAEVCNGVDDNCDGVIDEAGATGQQEWFADADLDGFGDPTQSVTACAAPDDHVLDATDCNDSDDQVFPGATERCNGVDDDCDAVVDPATAEDAGTWYRDADTDGFGDPAVTEVACTVPTGFVADATDCDDGRSSVFPGATEVCNGLDDDCDTVIDPATSDGAPSWYRDNDGDGFGDGSNPLVACDLPSGYVADATDCDDALAGVFPGAPEVCNGLDDDCDNAIDPPTSSGAVTWYVDADSDGYGDATLSTVACTAPPGHVADATDCDDTRSDVSPGAPEVCDALDTDEDCDGVADEPGAQGELAYWLDQDQDGFGDPVLQPAACDWPSGAIVPGTLADCNDGDGSIFPTAAEVCDGVDQDCDGILDEDAIDVRTFYRDDDGDGFGSEPVEACEPLPGTTTEAGDCDDGDDDTFPGAPEVANDGVDQDCDGADLIEEAPAPEDTGTAPPPDDVEPEPDPSAPPRGNEPPELRGCTTTGPLTPMGTGSLLLLGGLWGLRRRSHRRCAQP